MNIFIRFLSSICLFSIINSNILKSQNEISTILNTDIIEIVPPFQVNQNSGPRGADQTYPRVSSFSYYSSHYVIWNDERAGDHSGLYMQVVTPYNLLKNIFIHDDIEDSNPEATYDITLSGGEEIITWFSAKDRNLYIQKYDQGRAIGEHEKANDAEDPAKFCPYYLGSSSVKSTRLGNILLVWEKKCQGIGQTIYFQKFSSALEKIGELKQVNDTSDFNFVNTNPSFSVNKNENVAITWLASGISADQNSIMVQLYDADGSKKGNNIRIDQTEVGSNNYSNPAITYLPNGNSMVAWNSTFRDTLYIPNSETGNIYSRVYAQLLSSTGEKIEDNFVINNDGYDKTNKDNTCIAADTSGTVMVAWVEHRETIFDFDIFAQLYSSDGTPVGNNFIVNADRSGRQNHPAISVRSEFESSQFVITWEDGRSGYDKDIYAQMFNADGSFIHDNIKLNNDEGSSNQLYPSICTTKNNNIIISWWDHKKNGSIFAQQFSEDGTPIGWNFEIPQNDHTVPHSTPSFCITKDDELAFSWISDDEFYSDYTIMFQKFSTSGTTINEPTHLTYNFLSNISNPSIGCDSIGNFFTTWTSKAINSTSQYRHIFLKKQYANSIFQPRNFIVNDNRESEAKKNPKIAVSPNGYFSIGWIDNHYSSDYSNIFLQPFSNENNGERIGSNIKVNDNDENTSTEQKQLDIAINKEGNSTVVWTDNRTGKYNIFIQRFTKDGEKIDNNFKVSNREVNQYSPAISIDKENKFIITWTEWLNNSWAIMGQRYLQDGKSFGESFLVAETNVINERHNLVFPAVKLRKNKIIATWADTRKGNTAYDIWANIINWDDLVKVQNDRKVSIENDFYLNQNYPNPFNPVTTIKYSVPNVASGFSLSDVKLTVYDVLGNEISNLVDEKKSNGKYEVKFDGTNLSSGIYYYKIQVGKYSDVRKMILLK